MQLNHFFNPGRLTFVYDMGAGSSGKGKIGSYLIENSDCAAFAVNTFHPQAGHWVRLDDGREFFYQTLNSCAYLHEKLEALYIAPGAMIELPALLREIEENGVPANKLRISPIVPILDDGIDKAFEQGLAGFDGAPIEGRHEGTAKFGSTAHGVGSCNARRALRRPSLRLARDVPELRPYIADVPGEIMERLDRGQSGMMELAQGFQLSLMHPRFYPMTTSRNVTVSQGLADAMLPTRYAGQVIGNLRTFPIRINSNKYIAKDDGRHLTWAEVQAGVPHDVYEGNSGHWYEDQREISWQALTAMSGSPTPIMEITSVTKLPRRVATFSLQNVAEAIRHNRTEFAHHLSLNFANYVDYSMTDVRSESGITQRFKDWVIQNLAQYAGLVKFVGTGAATESTIYTPVGMYGGRPQLIDGSVSAGSAFDAQMAD